MSLKPILKKPSRSELLDVINQLQMLLGDAKHAVWNDRSPERMSLVVKPLEEGFDLCVSALAFDAPRAIGDRS